MKPGSAAQVKGSDPRKALLADVLWLRALVSQAMLADKLAMKSAAHLGQQLRRLDGKAAIQKVREELKHFLEETDATKS